MMPDVEIRAVSPEELVTLGVSAYAFAKSPQPPDPERRQQRIKYAGASLGLAVFENGAPEASCTIQLMTENVRGRIVQMGGIGGVASFPEARRKGYVRSMLTQSLQVMRERGDAASTLYPFRNSFYERLGYAELLKNRVTTINPNDLTPLLRMELPGTTTQQGMETGFESWRGFLERYQANHHGFALREWDQAIESRDTNDRWVALVHEGGEVTGAMTFRITGYGETLRVDTFFPTTIASRYQLLAWIARHADQVARATIELRPDAHPEIWFRDLTTATSTENEHVWPAPMARVVDISRLAGISVGDAPAFSLHISDEQAPWNSGVWTFASDHGALTVEPGGAAIGDITIQGLSASIWTGVDPATFRYRGWGDPSPEVQELLRTMFPATCPYLYESF